VSAFIICILKHSCSGNKTKDIIEEDRPNIESRFCPTDDSSVFPRFNDKKQESKEEETSSSLQTPD
jgi:hypothetical protein